MYKFYVYHNICIRNILNHYKNCLKFVYEAAELYTKRLALKCYPEFLIYQ